MVYQISTNTLLFLTIICVVIGLLVGLAIGLLRGGGKENQKPRKGLDEVGKIWKDKLTGKVFLTLDNQTAETVQELSAEEQKNIGQVINSLVDWAGMGIKEAPTAPAPTEVALVRPPAGEHHLQPARGTGPLSNRLSQMENMPQADQNEVALFGQSESIQKPRLDPLRGFRTALEGDVSQKLDQQKERSIAAQVDEILQEDIHGTELEARAVRLMELPGKGMVVLIGMKQYDSVDAVPEEDVKAVIRAAVGKWEKKMLG